MPRKQYTEAEIAELEQLSDLGRLAQKLATNEKTRRPFLKAVKEVEPERVFVDQEIADLRDEIKEQRETDEIAAAGRAEEQRLAAQRASLAGTFTEDQIKEIETNVMVKYRLNDYEAAAKIYGADLAPAYTADGFPARLDAGWTLPSIQGLTEDPTKAARAEAIKVIDEFRGQRRAAR